MVATNFMHMIKCDQKLVYRVMEQKFCYNPDCLYVSGFFASTGIEYKVESFPVEMRYINFRIQLLPSLPFINMCSILLIDIFKLLLTYSQQPR